MNSCRRKIAGRWPEPADWNASFFATEQFSGIKGKLVSLQDALDGCERILHDEFKDYPESALYMIGAIGEARKADSKAGPKAAPQAKAKPAGHES